MQAHKRTIRSEEGPVCRTVLEIATKAIANLIMVSLYEEAVENLRRVFHVPFGGILQLGGVNLQVPCKEEHYRLICHPCTLKLMRRRIAQSYPEFIWCVGYF